MKFQSIYIFIVFFAVVGFAQLNNKQSGKLSAQENLDRLNTCGTEGILRPSTDAIPQPFGPQNWFRSVFSRNPLTISGACQISTRHLIALSNVVTSDGKTWISGSKIQCDNKGNAEVPKEILNLMILGFDTCHRKPKKQDCDKTFLKIMKAYILNLCKPIFKNIRKSAILRFPMVMEIEENVMANGMACVADRYTKVDIGQHLDAYGIGVNNGKGEGKHQKVQISKIESNLYATSQYFENGTFGGPIIDADNEKWTIVGIGENANSSDPKFVPKFFKMREFGDSLCETVGICELQRNDGRLSEKENDLRLMNCGKEDFPALGHASSSIPNVQVSTATLISPRHFLVTSQLVTLNDKIWRFNTEKLDYTSCTNGKDLEIPQEASNQLKVAYSDAKDIRVIRAYILNMCELETMKKRFSITDSPMVVEVETDLKIEMACLADRLTSLRISETLDAYSYGNGIKQRKVKLEKTFVRLLGTTYYPEFEGPLAMIDEGSRTVVGIGAATSDNNRKLYFKAQYLHDSLCNTIGVCGRKRKGGKLSEEENDRRLMSCGMDALPQPSKNQTGIQFSAKEHLPLLRIHEQYFNTFNWLYWVRGQSNTWDNTWSAASMISPRHFITSSKTVLTDDVKWITNMKDMVRTSCKPGSNDGYLEVPQFALKDLQFAMNRKKVHPIKAYILHVCHEKIFSNFKENHLPMLVEIDDDFVASTPCLTDGLELVNGDKLDAYGYNVGGMKTMMHRIVEYKRSPADMIHTTNYYEARDRGGPLIKIHDGGIWSIVGIRTSTAVKSSQRTEFFKIQSLLPVLCELAGICWKNIRSTPSPPVTTMDPNIKVPIESTKAKILITTTTEELTSTVVPTTTTTKPTTMVVPETTTKPTTVVVPKITRMPKTIAVPKATTKDPATIVVPATAIQLTTPVVATISTTTSTTITETKPPSSNLTTEKSIDISSSTPLPTTDNPTTIPSPSKPPQPQPPPSVNEEPKKTDADKDYEEHMEKKELLKDDDDDIDTDFFVDEDFLNGAEARRICTMELLFALIFVIFFF